MDPLPAARPPRREERGGPLSGPVGEEAQAALLGKPLGGAHELPRRRVLQARPGLEVGVVHHDVGVHDAALVVVMVDDGRLEPREVLGDPRARQVAERLEGDAVPRVGAQDVVLVGPRGPPLPRRVVAVGDSREVHLLRPVPEPAGVLGRPGEVREVHGERAPAPGEVAHDAAAPGVAADWLDDGHR